jgi:mannosyltransferase
MPPSQAPANQSASTSRQSDSVHSARWLTLFLLLAACAGLRLASLAAKPFWFDECFSVELARIDWRNFLHLLWWREANMSLYYALLRAWLQIVPTFGQSEFFIRGLSVLVSVVTLPVIYWLGRLLYDRRVALIAATLFAFNAYSVRYAQEARSYALFLLLTTVSSSLLICWLRRPTRRNWMSYVVTSILAVYAHFYALLLIVAQGIVLRWLGAPVLSLGNDSVSHDRAAFNAELKRAWKTIAVAVLPLLIFVAKTGAGPIRWIQRPSLHHLLEFFEHLAGSDSWPLAAIYALACLAAIAALGKRLWTRDQSWESWRVQFLLVWLLFPVVLTVVLSFARPVFLGRYMIFCLPPLLVLAAAGLARIRQSALLAAALTLMLFLSLRGVFFVYGHDFDDERDASGAASNFILNHAQPEDGVIFHIAETRVPYEFFRSERSGENSASPAFTAHLGPEILFPHHGAGLDYRDFTGKPTADFLRAVAPAHSRVWVMLMNNGPPGHPDPTTVMLTETLPQVFPKVQRWQFPKVEVRLYSN